MNFYIILSTFFLFSTFTFGQNIPKEYFDLVKKADSLFNSKEFQNSANKYTEAFMSTGWKGITGDRYNAARSWAMSSVPDSAFFQLERIVNKANYSDYDKIINDTNLISLHNDLRWIPLLDKIKKIKYKDIDTIIPRWAYLVPGSHFFYTNEIKKGLFFTLIPATLITSGLILSKKLDQNSNHTSAYNNFPFIMGIQISTFATNDILIREMKKNTSNIKNFNYDTINFNELQKSPFRLKNIFTPIVAGFTLTALTELLIPIFKSHQTIKNVDQFSLIGNYTNKNIALPIYSIVGLGVSIGAGTTEELMFRNMLMPILDYKYGQKKGLMYSSLAFGGIHALNVFFEKKPNYLASFLQVTEATVLGYFLGRDVQKRGYKIGPAIAAHTIYDLILTTGSFLIDPKNNFIGVNVKFKI